MTSIRRGPLQWETSVTIHAPKDRVWAIGDDISLIPKYHPEVGKVDLLSGSGTRTLGTKYRCTITEGRKGSCVEEVVECVPGERITTAFPEDTWGISKMFADFIVETLVLPHGEGETELVLKAYYDPIGWISKILNKVFLRRLMARRAQRTIAGIKEMAEGG